MVIFECVNVIRYLLVIIYSKMNFESHIIKTNKKSFVRMECNFYHQ